MPRPKRPKPIHTVPTKLRVAESTIISKAQKQRQGLAPQDSESFINSSDDSDGLVRKNRNGPNVIVGDSQLYMMSGALGEDAVEAPRLRPPTEKTMAELPKSTSQADLAKFTDERHSRHGKIQSAQVIGPNEIPSSQPYSPPFIDRLSPDKPNESAANLNNRPSMGLRIQGTPLVQPSMLGRAQFKKRARQPSLLQLAQAHKEGTEAFDDEDLYDFRPDDESTPLVKSLLQSRHRPTTSSLPSMGSRKRKLSTPEIQVPASQSQGQRSSTPSDSSHSLEDEGTCDLSPHEDNGRPEPTLPRLRQTRTPSPQIFSDTLAPPQSSSSPAKASPQAGRFKRRKLATTAKDAVHNQRNQTSPAPSSHSNTPISHLPSGPKQRPPPKPLTTASLQNLLPRRRRRPKPQSTYDVPSSSDVELDMTHLGEDEDELSFHAASKIRRKKLTTHPPKRGPKKRAKDNTKSALEGKRVSKTYTRKSIVGSHSEDDENGAVDEDIDTVIDGQKGTVPLLDAKAQVEMKRLADKFREVDEYALEFEDMTGSSSQMRDAR